jgi:anti-sigma factor RsiW
MKDTATRHCHKEDLLLYYYGELADQQQTELAEHLADCESCNKEWQQLQRALQGMALPAIELGSVETKKFATRVAERAQRPRRSKLWLWGGALTVSAVLALSLIIRPPGLIPGQGNGLVADATMVQELELLQNMELLEDLDLLQGLEGQG